MDNVTDPPPVEELTTHLDGDSIKEAEVCLKRLQISGTEERKDALRALRTYTSDHPQILASIAPTLTLFLIDEERSIRLTTAKLFVTLAKDEPDAVLTVISSLADRLSDDEEFYYVRARSAEALGYVAREHPAEVATPEILADLRIGLSFDESEVKVKLAKALKHIALGDPRRLRHQTSDLAEHLTHDSELVRYHLCTALVVVGCECPEALSEIQNSLASRLDDENMYVRGRAAEALGLLVRDDGENTSFPEEELAVMEADEESFVTDRARFVTSALGDADEMDEALDRIGTVGLIRETTDKIAEEITSPDRDGECPNCGLSLPEHRPPMCPRCGAPY